MAPPQKVSLDVAFSSFQETWSPRIAGEVNGFQVKLARVDGEFTWHSHADEDELFLVHRGRLRLRFRDGDVELGPGEMIVVPRGVEHLPVGFDDCQIVLFEPATVINTGDADDPRRQTELERLG